MTLVRNTEALTGDQQQQLDELCLTYEDQWQAGKRPVMEPYLRQGDAEIQSILFTELLLLELEYRKKLGETPASEDYQSRFPGATETIDQALAVVAGRDITIQFWPGHSIGRYRVCQELGRGSFGTVYRARDDQLNRDVAIKVPHRSRVFPQPTRQRLLDEAQAVAQLECPTIVAVYDIGQLPDGTLYLVMQFVDGPSLASKLERGPLPIRQAVSIAVDIATALACAHNDRIVHRDLKPSNILLDNHGNAHVADFGLALRESEQHKHEGECAGTLAYMAPEQLQGQTEHMDGRADIWALGVLLYEMLAGRRPFRGANRQEFIVAVTQHTPKPLRQQNRDLPRVLDDVCRKCLARSPANRYGSAHDIAAQLTRWLSRAGTPRRHWATVTTLVLLCCLIALPIAPRRDSQPPLLHEKLPLSGTFDLFIWSTDGDDTDMVRLSNTDGRRPLLTTDRLRLTAQMNRPAYVYVVWLDTHGQPLPVFPWRNGRWTDRPGDESKVFAVELPDDPDQAWPMSDDPTGMETLLMLARSTPLPSDVDLQRILLALHAVELPVRSKLYWFENGRVVRAPDTPRGVNLDQIQYLDDPILKLQHQILDVLSPHFELIRSVSFPVQSDATTP